MRARVAALALAIAASAALFAPVALAQSRTTVWRGGVLADDEARAALRLRSLQARELAASASDVLLALQVVSAGVDTLALPLANDQPDLAWQAGASYALALATTLFVGSVVKDRVPRARPFERGATRGDFASFYSLHAGAAFTAAGTSCAMQLERSPDRDLAARALSCAMSLTLAAVTGTLRIASDRHYLSDVVVGGLVGFLVGFVLPLLFVDRPTMAGGANRGEVALRL